MNQGLYEVVKGYAQRSNTKQSLNDSAITHNSKELSV